jgi:hypothetical protein
MNGFGYERHNGGVGLKVSGEFRFIGIEQTHTDDSRRLKNGAERAPQIAVLDSAQKAARQASPFGDVLSRHFFVDPCLADQLTEKSRSCLRIVGTGPVELWQDDPLIVHLNLHGLFIDHQWSVVNGYGPLTDHERPNGSFMEHPQALTSISI